MTAISTFFIWMGSFFVNTLSWWQWTVLAVVPPAIIALYFLKLKRRPLEVPSTYLWHRSIEDLHVNTIWQRLRRNLLLFLQLLLLAVLMLALLRPSWQGRKLTGNRFIFLVDNSASMQATDVGPSRLAEAKRRAGDLIGEMNSGDVAMVVSFSDSARVEQTFTDDRRQLRRSLDAIRPTSRPTSLLEALKVASGLANPGRSSPEMTDFQVAEALPAKLMIFSDGRFAPVTGFSLGNLEPVFVPIGDAGAGNIAIVAFSVRRSETQAGMLQAFARVENFGAEEAGVALKLLMDGRTIDADRLKIPAGEAQGVTFDLGAVTSGVLKLQAAVDAGDAVGSGNSGSAAQDALAVDDEAYAVVDPPRRAHVLLVTPGNEPLEFALGTDSSKEIAEVEVKPPAFLDTPQYVSAALGGTYDLVIFDRCSPRTPKEKPEVPQANTLTIGAVPPSAGWSAGPKADLPQIIDVETSHPLMQWTDLGDVVLLEGTPLELPPGGSVLIDSDAGAMLGLAPRERFEDVAMGFVILGEAAGKDGKIERYIGTNWPTRQSFPVFVRNMLEYFGGRQDREDSGSVRPGVPVALEGPSPKSRLRVRDPGGEQHDLTGGDMGRFSFSDTGELGVYEAFADGKPLRRFAVNLFDGVESDIGPDLEPSIQIGYVKLAGQPGWEVARRESWKGLLVLGLAVLLLEWYIYNRRVYL